MGIRGALGSLKEIFLKIECLFAFPASFCQPCLFHANWSKIYFKEFCVISAATPRNTKSRTIGWSFGLKKTHTSRLTHIRYWNKTRMMLRSCKVIFNLVNEERENDGEREIEEEVDVLNLKTLIIRNIRFSKFEVFKYSSFWIIWLFFFWKIILKMWKHLLI